MLSQKKYLSKPKPRSRSSSNKSSGSSSSSSSNSSSSSDSDTDTDTDNAVNNGLKSDLVGQEFGKTKATKTIINLVNIIEKDNYPNEVLQAIDFNAIKKYIENKVIDFKLNKIYNERLNMLIKKRILCRKIIKYEKAHKLKSSDLSKLFLQDYSQLEIKHTNMIKMVEAREQQIKDQKMKEQQKIADKQKQKQKQKPEEVEKSDLEKMEKMERLVKIKQLEIQMKLLDVQEKEILEKEKLRNKSSVKSTPKSSIKSTPKSSNKSHFINKEHGDRKPDNSEKIAHILGHAKRVRDYAENDISARVQINNGNISKDIIINKIQQMRKYLEIFNANDKDFEEKLSQQPLANLITLYNTLYRNNIIKCIEKDIARLGLNKEDNSCEKKDIIELENMRKEFADKYTEQSLARIKNVHKPIISDIMSDSMLKNNICKFGVGCNLLKAGVCKFKHEAKPETVLKKCLSCDEQFEGDPRNSQCQKCFIKSHYIKCQCGDKVVRTYCCCPKEECIERCRKEPCFKFSVPCGDHPKFKTTAEKIGIKKN